MSMNSICTLKGSTVELSCSYTYPRGYTVTTTKWYKWKNSIWTEIQDKYEDRIEYRGNKENDCTLRITDLREEDSAEYKFIFNTHTSRWGYSLTGTTLTVTDLQVEVTLATEAGRRTLTCTTTCTLSDNPNPTFIWYKNGQHLDESTYKVKYSVSSNYEDSYSCAVKGHEDLRSPAVCECGLNPDKACVQGQDCNRVTYTKRRICVLKGSSVDISCTYGSGYDTVTSSLWFSPKQSARWSDKLIPEDITTDPGYAGRVEYGGEKERGHSTLRITDLREEDSAEYKFIFNTHTSRWGYSFTGTTLTVTDLQVKVTTTWWSTTLTCSTTCTLTDNPNPTYIWYRNSKIVQEDSSPSYSVYLKTEDSFYCAVKGINSPAVYVGGHSYFHVTYTHQSICTLKGSSVDISCSYTYPSGHRVSETNWYTKGKLDEAPQILSPGYGGRVEYLRNMQSDSTLRITDLREEDSAEYKLRVITDQTNCMSHLINTANYYFMICVLIPFHLGLQVKVTPATVTEGQKVTLTCSTTTCTLSDNPNPTYICSEDAGRYSCAVEGHEDLRSPEETLTVRYGPKDSSVSVSPSGEIVKGSSVTLTCSSDANPPVDKYTWYKKNITSPKASGQSYNITNISSEDSGEYYCEARNKITSKNSTALMIIGDSSPVCDNISGMVMTPTATQTAANVDQDVVHCASVHFSHSKNQEVPLYSTVQLPQPQKQDEDVQYAAVKFNRPTAATQSNLSLSPGNVTETHIWDLFKTCGEIESISVLHERFCAFINLKNANMAALALERLQGVELESTRLVIRYPVLREPTLEASTPPQPPSTPPQDLQVEVTAAKEAERRTLTCITTCTLSDNPNPTYIWYKNGHYVKEDSSSLYSDNFSDKDSYSCAVKGHADLHSPEETLTVRYGPKDSSVSVSPSGEIVEGSSVTLTCSGDANPPVDKYTWYKKNITSPKASGQSYNITNISSEDSGEYYCEAENTIASKNSTALMIIVTPATVTEGQKVTLTCSTTTCTLSDNPNPTYIWYKNGHVTNQSNSLFLNPVSSEDAVRYSCAVEGHEDLHSPEETLTVRYGPKDSSVSVSPSGEIVEGSSVTLTCSSDANPPVDKYTWYKKNITSPKASGQSYNITNISSEESGEYYCEAGNKIASKNSTALMIIVAGKQTSVMTTAVGIIVVVLVLILCLSGLMWFRKKASKSTSDTRDTSDIAENGQGDSSPVYDNISGMVMTPTATQTAANVDQDVVHYTSVHFSRSKNQEVPLYSTVQLPQPQKQDEDVQYAAVKFNRPTAATQPAAAQSAEVIYCQGSQQTQNQEDLNTTNPEPRRPEHNKPRTKKT
ncbi:uncharacterized protein LOC121557164 [Coregonus clupeaformis]|uniref:uncharacterized protein LOC121557164 n=1 Tax=Coregonus clupeaformis TaxID=59861 RepID=UPI001E1C7292|nr:uncharacterized protein LOC121557164 [Coregonus clupeaformis]